MTIARSPLATIPKFVSFPEAIRSVIDGKSITKEEWEDPEIYGKLQGGLLMFYRDGKWHKWILNDGDLLGEDWVVLDG